MVVGYDISVFGNNKSGTETSLLEFSLVPSPKEFLEKIVERVVFFKRTSFELAVYALT